MNILPQKRWHVRTWDNIQRVKRDERKAAEEEKAIQERLALAEKEARTNYLRQKASKRQVTSGIDVSIESDVDGGGVGGSTSKHVNLFEEVETGMKKFGTNKEYEAEKKSEREKEEKAIGLLTYLGQSSAEALGADEKPWYLKGPDRETKDDSGDNDDGSSKKKLKTEKDLKIKNLLDPIKNMNKYLDMKNKYDDHKHKKSKKRDKHGKHSKHKPRCRESGSRSVSGSSSKSIEDLRAERLRRERGEEERSRALLAQHYGAGTGRGSEQGGQHSDREESPDVGDDRQRGYHSQFNPEFVRKPKHKIRRNVY